jgi:PAS domain S-box-containing protein
VDTDQFLRLMDLLPDPVLLLTTGGIVQAANHAARRGLGARDGRLVGRPLAELASDSPAKLDEYLGACARTRNTLPGTIHVADGQGVQRAYRTHGALLEPAREGAPGRIFLRLTSKEDSPSRFALLTERIAELTREVAARRRAETEVRAQKEWLRVTLASIGDGVIATDTSGRVSFINPVAEKLTGWGQAEAGGQPLDRVFRIVNEETRRPVENPVAEVLESGQTVGLASHTVLLSRDGSQWPIDDSAAPIRDERGELVGVVLIFREIGARRQMEEALRRRTAELLETDRRKNEFLAMLAHELRNPLAPIATSLEVLRLRSAGQTQFQAPLRMMERQTRQMARLVDDLLDISRITFGRIELRLQSVEAGSIVKLAAESCEPLLVERGHRLKLEVTEPLQIRGDPVRLEQVLRNLLSNAAKYTPPGGEICATASREDGMVVIRVKDSGIGIPRELLDRVFDLFVQADRSLDRSDGGLGIGLTLAREIVSLHGGSIEAASAGPGHGTELTVRLPATGPTGAAAEAPGA